MKHLVEEFNFVNNQIHVSVGIIPLNSQLLCVTFHTKVSTLERTGERL